MSTMEDTPVKIHVYSISLRSLLQEDIQHTHVSRTCCAEDGTIKVLLANCCRQPHNNGNITSACPCCGAAGHSEQREVAWPCLQFMSKSICEHQIQLERSKSLASTHCGEGPWLLSRSTGGGTTSNPPRMALEDHAHSQHAIPAAR